MWVCSFDYVLLSEYDVCLFLIIVGIFYYLDFCLHFSIITSEIFLMSFFSIIHFAKIITSSYNLITLNIYFWLSSLINVFITTFIPPGDDWLDKEENAKLSDVLFSWLLGETELDTTSDRQDSDIQVGKTWFVIIEIQTEIKLVYDVDNDQQWTYITFT